MPLSTKVIRVPVKLVDGQWELLYGGPVKVREGSIGELQLFTSPNGVLAGRTPLAALRDGDVAAVNVAADGFRER